MLNLPLEASDHFLRFVSSLGQLLFYLLVQGDVALQDFDLLRHLVMRLHELLCVFGLVVELSRQLVVLQDGQSGLRLELFIIECHQVCLSFLHLEIHLLGEFLHVLDLLKLSFVDPDHAFALLLLLLDFQVSDLLQDALFALLKIFVFDLEGLKNCSLLFEVFLHLLVFQSLRLIFLVVTDLLVRICVLLLLSCRLQQLDRHLLLGVRICVPLLCVFLSHTKVG